MSNSPYRRRKPSLLRNAWVYRHLIVASVVLGVMLWFILINGTIVTVVFPFGLGKIESKTGVVILLSATAGSATTALLMTLFLAVRRLRGPGRNPGDDDRDSARLPEDRPPSDYASKTTEGFTGAPWNPPKT